MLIAKQASTLVGFSRARSPPSCTMIITTVNEFVSKIHDRMPVLLRQKDFDAWLTGHAGVERLRPAANDYLQAWPVSRRVNSSLAADDDPTLIDRVAI